jgi:hypothetical protein
LDDILCFSAFDLGFAERACVSYLIGSSTDSREGSIPLS